jgi:nucleoside-diphosphate-sugar epimerase
MRVLVTGASGFIGLPVVKCLEKLGDKVLALSRVEPTRTLPSSVKWLKADLNSPDTYKDALKEFAPQVVIHLAWQGIPDFSFDTSYNNLYQSIELLSYVIGLGSCKKVLVSGSCWESNIVKGECLETIQGEVRDYFAWAKISLYSWLNIICKQKNIQILWMRIFYVYGPHQKTKSLIPTIFNQLKNSKLPDLQTPKNANDFVYIHDVADAFAKATSIDNKSGVYNLGSGQSTTLFEVCRIAEKLVLGTDTLTRDLENKYKDYSCDVDFWASSTKSKKYLGWQSTTSLEEGLANTWKWLNTK